MASTWATAEIDDHEPAAVAEAVGRDVEDTEDHGPLEGDGAPRGEPQRRRVDGKGGGDRVSEGKQVSGEQVQPGQHGKTGATAGDQRPVVAGQELETGRAAQADQGLEGLLAETGQVHHHRLQACGCGLGARRVPPVRQQDLLHRPRRMSREPGGDHAPAGSAGGAPRTGARAAA